MTDKRLSMDEIQGYVTDVAVNGEGADKLRALKMLMGQETGAAALPEPLNDAEIIERLARMIRAAGPSAARIAYRQAFPKTLGLDKGVPKVKDSDIIIDVTKLPVSLKQLYRMFPEVKRSGQPPGYPVRAGLAEKKAWVQREARKILLDREQRRVDTLAPEALSGAQ